jgi:predicted nucleotidyltransferase
VTDQLQSLADGVQQILGENLVGIYLHGSGVIDGPYPTSDLDVLVVAHRRTTDDEKRALLDVLREVSGRTADPGPDRPIELDVVVQSEIRPWTYPPPFDFHYDELIRDRFDAGELEPWDEPTNPDLTSIVRMARAASSSVAGPPPRDVLDEPPRDDLIDALTRDLHTETEWLERDTRNVVLTLARIWSGIETDDLHSKATAAAWALPRLPAEHRGVLERARDQYVAGTHGPWDDVMDEVRAYVDYVTAQIHARAKSP